MKISNENTKSLEREHKIGLALSLEISHDTQGTCPELEAIAMLCDDLLDGAERDNLLRHFATCDHCRQIFLTTKSMAQLPMVAHKKNFHWYIYSSVAAAAIIILVIQFSLHNSQHSAPMVTQDKTTSVPSVASVPPPVQASASASKAAIVKVKTESVAELSPLQLLTPEEASLPDAKITGFARQPASDGPDIIVDPEISGKEISGDQPLKVKFAARESTVDLKSFKFEALKSPTINLTERVAPYASSEGISIEKIKLPPGRYQFRIHISDINGRFSEKDFTLLVSRKF